MKRNKQWWSIGLALFMLVAPAIAYADTSSSAHYQVDQTFFGSGGELDASSANYRAKQTLGELGVGSTSSAHYRAFAGFNTTEDPYLELYVTGGIKDLGYLSEGTETTTFGEFYVRAWQAGGYVVRSESDPPKSDTGYTLPPLTTGDTSHPGTEQFGINLVDNSSPDVGAPLQQDPDASFAFGEVYAGYDTANTFKYNKGDIIAQSQQSTSRTIYTVSYLFNISSTTPAGQYTFNHILVATATY